MKRLFLKIFGLLLGGFLLTALITAGVAWYVTNEVRSEHDHSREVAEKIATEAVNAWQTGNLDRYRKKMKRRFGASIWILNTRNSSIDGNPAPPSLLAKIQRYPTLIRPVGRSGRARALFATEVVRDGTTYRVILQTRSRPFQAGRLIFLPLSLLIAFIVASVLLGRWILRPLRALRKSAETVQAGDLSSRVDASIASRNDPFGEVGTAFNRMTDRLANEIEARQTLLRDVSHELRTPLARMQVANAIAVQKQGDSAELQRMETEVERLDSLIESLLTLTRLQDGVALDRKAIDLESMLDSLIADACFEFQAEPRQVTLKTAHARQLIGDLTLLSRALENVLRNAMRHTAPGDEVRLSTNGFESGIQIHVEDSGPGVQDQHLERIFEPFHKFDSARTSDTNIHGGHGVGLAITRRVVEQHGGNVRARNRAQGGLEVIIWLPV